MGMSIKTHKPPSTRFKVRNADQERQIYDQRRGTAHSRGYTARWSRYSQDRLKRHPLCARHLERGLNVAAVCTDHKIPVQGPEDPLFWAEDNHQSLCHECHSIKTASEDGGFGNAKSRD